MHVVIQFSVYVCMCMCGGMGGRLPLLQMGVVNRFLNAAVFHLPTPACVCYTGKTQSLLALWQDLIVLSPPPPGFVPFLFKLAD